MTAEEKLERLKSEVEFLEIQELAPLKEKIKKIEKKMNSYTNAIQKLEEHLKLPCKFMVCNPWGDVLGKFRTEEEAKNYAMCWNPNRDYGLQIVEL